GSAKIEAAITLPTAQGAPATGDLRGAVHLEESEKSAIITGLLHLEERLEGTVDLNGRFHFRGAEWTGQGRLAARGVRYGDLAAETASMEVLAAGDHIELR